MGKKCVPYVAERYVKKNIAYMDRQLTKLKNEIREHLDKGNEFSQIYKNETALQSRFKNFAKRLNEIYGIHPTYEDIYYLLDLAEDSEKALTDEYWSEDYKDYLGETTNANILNHYKDRKEEQDDAYSYFEYEDDFSK